MGELLFIGFITYLGLTRMHELNINQMSVASRRQLNKVECEMFVATGDATHK